MEGKGRGRGRREEGERPLSNFVTTKFLHKQNHHNTRTINDISKTPIAAAPTSLLHFLSNVRMPYLFACEIQIYMHT